MNKLEDFVFPTQEELFKAIQKEIKGKKIVVPGKYILVVGEAPVMLLAHMDTVHKERVKVICKSADGNILMSPQGIGGDDRCGVYALVTAYRTSRVKPWLLFTCDEEIGGRGAEAFADDYGKGNVPDGMKDIKFLIEIDRRGHHDAVFYDCYNKDFISFIEDYGFEEDFGSYSDICDVAPAIGVAAVNLSSGYYQAHTQHEYINRKELNNTVRKVVQIVSDSLLDEVPQFEYVEKPPRYSTRGYKYYYDQYQWSLPAVLQEADDEIPADLPQQYASAYEDLLDFYTPEELESVREAYGDSVIIELYEDAFGPFTGDFDEDAFAQGISKIS